MKQTKFWQKASVVMLAVLMLLVGVMAVACAPTNSEDNNKPDDNKTTPPAVDKNKDIKSVYGTYTRFVGYDVLKDVFSTQITSFATDDSNFFENDTLVLLNSTVSRHENNTYNWTEGDRYVYTRHLQLTTCGLSFWQQYVGHYTWDEGTQNITLGFPELFSYQYFYGDASGTIFTDFGAANVKVDTSEEAIAAGKVRVLDNGKYLFAQEELGYAVDHRHGSGLYSFNYEIADYHNGAKEIGTMGLILDLNTMTYAFPKLDE